MKHKLLLAAGAALAAAAISVFVYVNNVNDSMDEFFNANVEALASGEGGSGAMCSQTGTPGDYLMYNCSSCNGMRRYDLDRVAFCR